VSRTIRITFRQTINQILKTQLLPMADKQADEILQQYPHARTYLEQTLEKEAEEKIVNNRRLLNAVEQKIAAYNQAIFSINSCLQAMSLYEHLLPVIGDTDMKSLSTVAKVDEISTSSSNNNGVVDIFKNS
jgi:hypothetical protein